MDQVQVGQVGVDNAQSGTVEIYKGCPLYLIQVIIRRTAGPSSPVPLAAEEVLHQRYRIIPLAKIIGWTWFRVDQR